MNLYLLLSLQPMLEIMPVLIAAFAVQLIGKRPDLLFHRFTLNARCSRSFLLFCHDASFVAL